MVVGSIPPWFLPWSDISARWAFLTELDISVEEDEDLHGG